MQTRTEFLSCVQFRIDYISEKQNASLRNNENLAGTGNEQRPHASLVLLKESNPPFGTVGLYPNLIFPDSRSSSHLKTLWDDLYRRTLILPGIWYAVQHAAGIQIVMSIATQIH